jgi:hypothetical protein
MKKAHRLFRPPLLIDDVEFLRDALSSVLPVVEPANVPIDFRIRFVKDASPFAEGDMSNFPLFSAIKAIQCGDAEFVNTVPADQGRAA